MQSVLIDSTSQEAARSTLAATNQISRNGVGFEHRTQDTLAKECSRGCSLHPASIGHSEDEIDEFQRHKALVNDAVTTAENLHGRYLGALRNNEYQVAQSISQAILLNKETESRAFENALLEFKEKSLINFANFNNLP